jgi:prepilin-type N-terminal cleavage/methylation domain-containing protein
MKRLFNKKKKGFSFLEVIVATFIFSIIMTTTAAVFGRSFTAYRTARAIQRDLENAQFAMNAIAKTLRTSTVLSLVPASPSSIRVFDHSQTTNNCIQFIFNNDNSLESRSGTTADSILCGTYSFGSYTDMTTGFVTGNFSGAASASGLVGRITISAEICPTNPCPGSPRDRARVQTTVSLRNP